jgi:outer membrane PBP1 activator LpoA protein
MIAKSVYLRFSFFVQPMPWRSASRLLVMLGLFTLINACSSTGSREGVATQPVSISGISLPGEQAEYKDLDAQLISRIKEEAVAKGPRAAESLYRSLIIERETTPATAALIESHLLWLEGDITRSEEKLITASALLGEKHAGIVNERIRRMVIQGNWLGASALIYRHQPANDRYQKPNEDILWASLLHVENAQLNKAIQNAGDEIWRGWLELNQAYRSDKAAVIAWVEANPTHPAAIAPPSNMLAWLNSAPPGQVAVLLPLSGRLEAAGSAVYEGILESLFETYPHSELRPQLFAVDSEAFADTGTAYRYIEQRQPDIVIGPLTKNGAALLRDDQFRTIPIISLNRPESTTADRPENWLSLSLAPEDEARQLAQLAFGKGQRRALIIQPNSDWGNRMGTALSHRWQDLGGTIVTRLVLQEEPSESEQISSVVGALESEERVSSVEAAFDAPVESRPRRRQDFDGIFLLAPDPDTARRLRPLLVYHYAGDIPVYASSAVVNDQGRTQNRDLNGLIVLEIPAHFKNIPISQTQRLNALGRDAVQLLGRWQQIKSADTTFIRANTGILSATNSGNIERELIPAVFDGGSLVPLTLP